MQVVITGASRGIGKALAARYMDLIVADLVQKHHRPALAALQPQHQMVQALRRLRRDRALAERTERQARRTCSRTCSRAPAARGVMPRAARGARPQTGPGAAAAIRGTGRHQRPRIIASRISARSMSAMAGAR
ncbi:MAG: hypothetical protein Kow0058_05220 [Roseovarius sp.]